MDTNIFKILKLEHKENYHSLFISSIIEYDEFAKKSFLKSIENATGGKFNIGSDSVCSKLKIVTEKNLSTVSNIKETKKCRVDIFFSDEHSGQQGNTRIIIENKIYAGDQPGQLIRYNNYLTESTKDSKFKKNYNGALFYLTIEGKDASNYSKLDFASKQSVKKNSDYFLLSYEKHIIPWLLSVKTNNSRLNSYIEDYIEITKELIEKLSRLSAMIESDYSNNEQIKKPEFNSFLELKFWEYIEQKLSTDSNISGISNRRLFSYEKIQITQKNKKNKKHERDYGIIFDLKKSNQKLAIFVDIKSFETYISVGEINEQNNMWNGERITDNSIKINQLRNKKNMEIMADAIVELATLRLHKS